MSDRRMPAPEFSRPVNADSVQDREKVETVEATPREREALARRFDLVSVDRLTATVRLRRVRGGQMIRVAGTLEAEVVQTSVVSLEAFSSRVAEDFTALFAPDHLIPREEEDLEAFLDQQGEGDTPEPIVNGKLDIGELVAQHLSLALDPYPRKPGEGHFQHIEDLDPDGEIPDIAPGAEEEGEGGEAAPRDPQRPNPFAALAKLKPKS
ncbi:MAG TPA: DUF177 domain-containing protein [Azospirillaceae bacterium]|nr:DUF177 domain-containing protein [Azospirillaceae bacterium]